MNRLVIASLLVVAVLLRSTASGAPALNEEIRVSSFQRDGTHLHHVTVDGLAEWIAWWDAQQASA